ncbi:MAG TPA: ABC transporter substrate-binding protein [Thermomicrobiales bacterium]|nr:ABC transporter substrate-binding protein [Thermomicrobiales bacterium]
MNTDDARASGVDPERRLRRRDLLRLALAGASAATVASILAACGASATPTAAPAAPTAAPTTAPTSAPTATTAPTAAPSGQATSAPAATAAPTATTAAAQPTSAPAASPAGSPAAAGQYAYPSGGKYSTLEPVGKQGGHLTEVSFADAKTLNPMLSTDSASGTLIAMMFNPLVDVNPDTGNPFPDLATDVPTQQNGGISADGLTYTFKLRPDVKWSDGTPFTSKDVVFTYTALANKDLGSPRTSDVTERIASVTAQDDATVVFKLKKIVAPFLTDNMYRIVPEHILGSVPIAQVKSHGFSTGDPKLTIGTGPFMFKEWVKDDHTTLVKNPNYFRGAPALDQYIYKIVKDANVATAQLKTGEADYSSIAASQFQEMSAQANVQALAYDTYGFTFYSYQLDPAKTTIFQDKAVRQALAYALDRDSMVKAIEFGLAKVAVGTEPVLSWAYAPDQITDKYPYDLNKANQLLDQAGWAKGSDGIRAKDGKKLSFTLWTNAGNTAREQYITVMQQMWKAIGVDASPKTEEWNAYLTRITETHDFEIFLVGFGWGVDPDQSTMWKTEDYKGGFNMNKYSNPQVDQLCDEGLATLDQAKRKQIYVQMQNLIMDDLPNFILDFPQSTVGVNKRVHNLNPNAINVRWNSYAWWVADGK